MEELFWGDLSFFIRRREYDIRAGCAGDGTKNTRRVRGSNGGGVGGKSVVCVWALPNNGVPGSVNKPHVHIHIHTHTISAYKFVSA